MNEIRTPVPIHFATGQQRGSTGQPRETQIVVGPVAPPRVGIWPARPLEQAWADQGVDGKRIAGTAEADSAFRQPCKGWAFADHFERLQRREDFWISRQDYA